MPSAGSEMSDAGRFRVENRRAHADERGRTNDHGVVGGVGEKDEPAQSKTHPAGEGIGFRPPIGIPTDERLQDRSGHLKGERDQPDLYETELKAGLEQRINRRDERLNRVV